MPNGPISALCLGVPAYLRSITCRRLLLVLLYPRPAARRLLVYVFIALVMGGLSIFSAEPGSFLEPSISMMDLDTPDNRSAEQI